jgi:hypothetical protein
VKVLILGGKRQGEWLELAAFAGKDPTTWLDLLTGDTYRIRRMTWAVADEKHQGHAAELWKLPVAVHPSYVAAGPQVEQQLAEQALSQVITAVYMTAFMREHAVLQEMEPVVPDTPAELIEEDRP